MIFRCFNFRDNTAARYLISCLFPLVLSVACAAQVASPSPTPDLPPPVQPNFVTASRPMPTIERVGVSSGNELSLSMEQAVEMALRNSNDIDASRNTTRMSDFSLTAAKGVYDPVVTAEQYYEKLTIPTASLIGGAVNGAVTQGRLFGSGGVSGFSPYQGGNYSALFNSSRTTTSNTNSFLNPQFPSSLALNYTQPLWRDRKIDFNRRTIEIARKNVEMTDAQLRAKAIDIISSVEKAYWDLVYSLRLQQIQNETLKQSREQLESNKRQVEKGILAPIEIVSANSQISTYEQNVYIAQELVTRAENNLKTLLLPDRTAVEWSQPITPTSPAAVDIPQISLEVAVTEALKNRPELAELDITSEINKIDERFYRNQTKPQIDLVGSYTLQGLAGTETPAAFSPTTGLSRVPPNLVGGYITSLGNLAAIDYPSYRVGVSISLPLRNRTAKANLGRTLVEAERIANTRAQAEQVVESEVRNALQSLRSAESRLASATDARVAAEELYASEQRQFRGGNSTFFLVSQRQTDLAQARGRELLARTDLNKSIAEFQRAIGNTLNANNVTVTR